MKILRSYFLFSAFVFLPVVFTSVSSAETSVYSRSIIPSCQFVYSVESDIKIISTSEEMMGPVLWLAWDNAWTDDVEFENSMFLEFELSSRDSEKGEGVQDIWQTTIQSMSTAESFLRRKMFLQWGEWDSRGQFLPLSQMYWADIGRRFGEACQTSRNPEIPFHRRELNLL